MVSFNLTKQDAEKKLTCLFPINQLSNLLGWRSFRCIYLLSRDLLKLLVHPWHCAENEEPAWVFLSVHWQKRGAGSSKYLGSRSSVKVDGVGTLSL